jgi:D-aminoacyl-tRNA deacylase
MRILLQRVDETYIRIEGEIRATSGKGLLLFIGIKNGDSESEASYLAEKVLNLRIFEDENGKMNLSVLDIKGGIAAVSQFTLYADTTKGRRPGFADSADPAEAVLLYNFFVSKLKESGLSISEGEFGAHMEIGLINNGPATFILEK